MDEPLRVVIGLGNPGERYADTRHNLGFMVVKRLLKRHGITEKKGHPLALLNPWNFQGKPVLLVRPRTYMNLSGQAARWIAETRQVPPSHMLVVVDEFALPLGRLRIRARGSAGGHNGLASLIEELGTQEYPRLRLGMGPVPEHREARDWVLEPFGPRELDTVEAMVESACDCVETWVTEGLQACMNRFNRDVAAEQPAESTLPPQS